MSLLPLILLSMSAAQAPAGEAAPADAPGMLRLSEAEKEDLLDAAVEKREAAEEALPEERRKVHGEVGFAIGTGGFRSIYGTSAVPLGENGMAVISFENTDFGKREHWRRRR